MKTKHTPGPWRYGRTLTHGLSVFSSPGVGSPEHIIAMGDLADSIANARLIAAAPDLLSALVSLTNNYAADARTMRDLLNDAHTAIKKATGEKT